MFAHIGILFAELDANGWAVIIAAVCLGVNQITSMILSYFRDREKMRLARDNSAHLEQQGETLATITKQTNGLVDKVAHASHETGKAMGMIEATKNNQVDTAAIILKTAELVAEKLLEKAAIAAQALEKARTATKPAE